MTKIRILPEQLANQIAAGEVVERPASVVKELLENSLDALADRVEVEIEGGGTRLIRIIDNGEGMDEDDLLMSLERHGTSKIKTEDDLGAIGTLGFRGEAIPSIGSVSQLTITSRPEQAELGTRVVLHYGKLTKVQETGCSFGTTVEVRNLFGNTPARRKFLRTARTELGHIDEVIKNYALGSPGVTFILRIDGRDSLYLDNSLSVEQRLAGIMHYDGPFIAVGGEQKAKSLRQVSGFLVPPEKATIGPARMRLFVNGRAVRDRMIIHGITEGMRGFLMKGKNPCGLLHLRLPVDEVDVNVHPAKHEVRFRNGRDVHTLLCETVTQAMRDYQQTIKSVIFSFDSSLERSPVPSDSDGVATGSFAVSPGSVGRPVPGISRQQKPHRGETGISPATTKERTAPRQSTKPPAASQPLFATAEPMQPMPKEPAAEKPLSINEERSKEGDRPTRHNLLVIGQYDDLYIFCKNSTGLLVIDQHAAHERLLYEKLRKQYLANSVVRQTLMFPEQIELSLFQSRLVEKNRQAIEKIGFTLREFGGNTYLISAVPALAGLASPRELFLDILEQFGSENNKGDKGGLLDNILATMACRAAVKAGTELSRQEIDTLLNEMTRADLFSHCPHGRPVARQFSREEIKKWFYRG